MNKQAILLMGPTATGKTDLAIELAQLYPIEIISVDSALIYRDMNIGTAKPTLQQLNKVAHHLIDIISPLESYSVAEFIQDSMCLIHDIHKRGHLPILVGGTMMYFNGLLNGMSVLPKSDTKIRTLLEKEVKEHGLAHLYQQLALIDPVTAHKINPNDKQRIMRSLEVYRISGEVISVLQANSHVHLASEIDFIPVSIMCDDRDILHKRINQRFIKMLDDGFVDEVSKLRNKYPTLTYEYTAMRSVGYYQVWQYLEGLISFDELILQGSAATRQLAKRQITWLRKMNSYNINNQDNLEYNILKDNIIAYLKAKIKL